MKHKNVLFLAIDQWRADCLGFQGHPIVKTPNLDKLAQDSVVFHNHFTTTCPCGPARTSLLTGLYAMNHRSVRNGTPLDARFTNIAKEAQKAGYRPVLFGYTDSSVDPRGLASNDPRLKTYEGILPGFDVEAVLNEECLDYWGEELANKGYQLPADLYDLYRAKDRHANGFSTDAASYKSEDSDTAFIVDQIIGYTTATHDPWFIHGVVLKPHPPLIAPTPFNNMYSPDDIPVPSRLKDRQAERQSHPYLAAWLEDQNRIGQYTPDINTQTISDDELRKMTAIYYGLISEVDHHLGRLFNHLKQIGQWDNTLIIFTSDHGEQLGEHWCWGKNGFFDASYHIPLIIRDPCASDGNISSKPVHDLTESVDIMPTILDWLDCEIPQTLSGQSLHPQINATEIITHRDFAFYEFDFRNPATLFYETQLKLKPDQCCLNVIRDKDYKYVHFAALPPLLFDLKNDPHELNNIANSPKHQNRVRDYAQALLSHKMLHVDRNLTNFMLGPQGIKEYKGPRT